MHMKCPEVIGRDGWDWAEQKTLYEKHSPHEVGEETFVRIGARWRKYKAGRPRDAVIVVVVVVVVVVVDVVVVVVVVVVVAVVDVVFCCDDCVCFCCCWCCCSFC